jgi:hypothetical protein
LKTTASRHRNIQDDYVRPKLAGFRQYGRSVEDFPDHVELPG